MLRTVFETLARSAARRSLPVYEGEVLVPGLAREVPVVFDHARVPHLMAPDEASLFFANGWVHAMERMWQMDLSRRAVAGRLAELFGDRPIDWRDFHIHLKGGSLADVDFFFRTLGLRHASEEVAAGLDARTRAALDAYAAGVNAWLAGRERRRLPVEFRLLHHAPEPWTAVDSISVIRGMALELNVSWKYILLQAAAARELPEELRADFLPHGYAPGDPCIAELVALDEAAREFMGWRGPGVGSNNWVLGGSRTRSGRPLLANDPHLRLRTPGVWYLAHLRGGDYDVVGGTLPGVPGVVIGRNPFVAWGLTNGMIHDADLFVERLDGDRYQTPDGWEPLQARSETIVRKGRKPLVRTVRSTRHGPLLSDALVNRKAETGTGLALQWMAHRPSGELAALLAVNRARSGAELRECLRGFGCPAQNVVYADVDGNIGYQLAAAVPVRRTGRGQAPVPGWTGEHDWIGTVPFEELPHVENPPEGFLATANNQVVDEAYPHYLSVMWEPPFRIRRIRQRLAGPERLGPEDMADLQRDVVHLEALDFMEDVLRPSWEALERRGLTPAAGRLLDLLVAWDGSCDVDSVPAAAFHALHDRLLHRVLGERLAQSTFFAYLEHFSEGSAILRRLLRRPDSPWWAPQGRDEVLALALEDAVHFLQDRLGQNMEEWRWGRLHKAVFVHPLGATPATRRFFQGEDRPTPGSSGTVNVGQFFFTRPFDHTVAPGYRQIVDFAPEGRSRFVAATGQSGNPVSPHCRDGTDRWARGEYLGMDLRPPAHLPPLRLLPAGSGAHPGNPRG